MVSDEEEFREQVKKEAKAATDERPSPRWLVDDLAEAIGGFDVDPASGAEPEPIAPTRYTKEDDGLTSPWSGKTWLNPPYSDPGPWLEKAREVIENGEADIVVALVKGDTSTDWYQVHAFEADYTVFLDRRLRFGKPTDAPFPSHLLVYTNEDPEESKELADLLAKASDYGKLRVIGF